LNTATEPAADAGDQIISRKLSEKRVASISR